MPTIGKVPVAEISNYPLLSILSFLHGPIANQLKSYISQSPLQWVWPHY